MTEQHQEEQEEQYDAEQYIKFRSEERRILEQKGRECPDKINGKR